MSEKDTKSKRNFSTKFLILAVVFALAAGLLAGTSGSNLIVEAASRVGLKIPVMASDSPDFSDARSIYYMLKSKYNGDISNEKLKAYLNKGVAAAAEDPYTEEQIEAIKTRILNALEEVIDPELGIDIVNLGLIYEIRFDGETGHTEIDMTLTTMGCPLADLLTDQIYDAMTDVPEVTNTEVKLVWYPAWTVEKMSRYARIALGIK